MTNPSDPDLIFYACIAKETTILAEFNSKDADLGSIAFDCLEKTPQFHSVFSHSVHNKTYMFIFEKPYTYFGIFDENLEKPSCISFLKSVVDSFNLILEQNPLKRLTTINPHCFQGDFNPVFHQLIAPHSDMDLTVSPPQAEKMGDGGSVRNGSTPLLGGSTKKRFLAHFGIGNKNGARNKHSAPKESKVDVSSEHNIALSREFSLVSSHNKNGLFAVDKAKRVWRRHLWVVLSLDLFVCVILFVVWLCVCQGFECLAA